MPPVATPSGNGLANRHSRLANSLQLRIMKLRLRTMLQTLQTTISPVLKQLYIREIVRQK